MQAARRILFLAYYFPPYNSIGAVRAAKLARHWHARGIDLRVLSAAPQPFGETLLNEVPEELVTRTSWIDVNALPRFFLGGRARVAAEGFTTETPAVAGLGRLYRTLLNFPDGEIGWLPHAVRAGGRLLRGWRPDLIYASARPFTALIAAQRLARAHRLPWIAELRDLWADPAHYYYPHPSWRRWIERRVEASVLKSAEGLVTISEPLAERLGAFGRPVEVVMHGVDDGEQPSAARTAFDGLRIVHTGTIYPPYRDPVPLFRALAQLRGKAPVRAEFYGRTSADLLRRAAREHGVEDLVLVSAPVPHRESIALQRGADVCLLLLWSQPGQPGIFTGKLFEYLGARRPILAMGAGDDGAGRLVRTRDAGLVSADPTVIAGWLHARWEEKRRSGRVAELPESVANGLTRREQLERLDRFIDRCLEGKVQ